MDGILNINKPSGRTSFSIVTLVRRLTRERRVGYAGTLDPAASGVLPVCFGRGTRVIEFIVDTTKTYLAEFELGVATDTYDATGNIIHRGDASGINQEQLVIALAPFHGLIEQTPPMYSAVKYRGKPLYKLARAGIQVERQSRLVKIYHIELVGWQPPVATVKILCGKGTYIRSLAHDLGLVLGCGAHLKSLLRLKCGIFNIESSITIHQLENTFHNDYWQQFVYPIDAVLSHWTELIVSPSEENDIRQGRPLFWLSSNHPNLPATDHFCRAYTQNGYFLSILRSNPEGKQWLPEKVFH
ncbi:tRNA pseudouridine(55) synthase TruB [Chloroflexota bacterium]